ncbi:MAG: hypothetical protein ACLQU3_18210 [Limisphaerales bacterium]
MNKRFALKAGKWTDWLRRSPALIVTVMFALRGALASPLNDFDKSIVAFVFADCAISNAVTHTIETKRVPIGTCFGIAVRQTLPLTNAAGYIVTAKHVLIDTNGNHPRWVFLRVNTSLGHFEYVGIDLDPAKGFKIYTHPDKAVDIAVIDAQPPGGEGFWKMKWEDAATIATKEIIQKYAIQEGDEMFFTGLFLPFYGAQENIPICRFGSLAMLPREKIGIAPNEKADLFLMEGQSFPGNSGSPVFFHFSNTRVPQVPAVYYLAGVMKGYFKDYSEAEIVSETANTYLHGNAGVAAVTPAYLLLDILNCDELKEKRAETERSLRLQQGIK